MQFSGRIPLIALLVAVCAFADTSGQGALDTWPANVQVNQDHRGNPQAETSLAADPNDPLHLVAIWWEVTSITPERWDKRLIYGWTRDGGQTWQSRRLETGVWASDPSIVADRQGNFYIASPVGEIFAPASGLQRVAIFKSTDGGETFSEISDATVDAFIDKPFISVDPATDALYVTWTDLIPVAGNHWARILLAVSTDHGATFSSPQRISDPSAYGSMAVPTVGPNGEVYVVWGSLYGGR